MTAELGLLEPAAVGTAIREPKKLAAEMLAHSAAISAKRQADALERIASAAEQIIGRLDRVIKEIAEVG